MSDLQAGFLTDQIIVLLSALLAAGSFIAFALPFLRHSERKERFRSIIEKRRQALFDTAKQDAAQRKSGQKKDETLSARESLAMLYRIQRQFGDMGEKTRTQLLQAGIRNPGAPVRYMMASLLLPVLFMGLAMVLISASDKEISNIVTLLILFAAMLAGFYLPHILIKNMILKRQEEINLAFPDALDMMLICVQGGIGLEQTVDRVAEEVSGYSPTLAEELGVLSAEMAMLNDRRGALQDFARRVGSGAARSFATALIQAEQYGTSISNAMRVMSEELRDQRMANAEQKAAALPPKLTVPMILFFLPGLFIIILGPAGIKATMGG